jgi:4-amino-4-deoxy-L-arabinose transferase-like glycosyltransferase
MDRLKNFLYLHRFEVVVVLLGIFYTLYHLILFNTTPVEQYPYNHQDLWRRLEDALFFLGKGNYPRMHPPLPSMLYALLLSFGSSHFYLFNIVNGVLGLFVTYALTLKLSGKKGISLIAAIFYLFNFYIIKHNIFYGLVDMWAVTGIMFGIYSYLHFKEKHSFKWAILTGLAFGITSIIQYSGVFALPIIFLFALFQKRATFFRLDVITKYFVLGLTSIMPLTIFSLYRLIVFGNPMFSEIDHFNYVQANISNLPVYLWWFVVFFSIPVVILSIAGLILTIKQKRFTDLEVFVYFIPYGIFFIFFYYWPDIRFIGYIMFPVLYTAAITSYKLLTNTKKITKVLTIVSLYLILLYSNLHNAGEVGIIYGSQQMFKFNYKTELNYFAPADLPLLTTRTMETSFLPYFDHMLGYRSRNDDPEVNYFTKRVNLDEVKQITEIVRIEATNNRNISIDLENEQFVRTHQILYYLGNFKRSQITYGFDILNTDILITDKNYDDISFNSNRKPTFTLLEQTETLRVYRVSY